MSTLQRLVVDGIPATALDNHTLVFHDDFTKGGIHAYDFLTSWPQAIQAADDAGVPYTDVIGGNLSTARACGDAISATAKAICLAVRDSGNFIDVPVPNDAFISHGNKPTQQRIDAYEVLYGNRTVRIYGNEPFISASFDPVVHDVANNGDTADSIITYTLKWKSASTNVLIEWGEHIAIGGSTTNGLNWGPGQGASSISGGPYHVSMDGIDGVSLGSIDNQLKGADVIPVPPDGQITIVKDAVPNDAQDFTFNTAVSNEEQRSLSFSSMTTLLTGRFRTRQQKEG
jgi:hypothetical protein